jgi:uncharacterized protein YfaS (alpha-2-macroglobulin family)
VPVSALAGFGDGQVNATISGLSLPGKPSPRCRNSGKSACVRRSRRRPSTAAPCCSPAKAGRRRRRNRRFRPQTLQGQLLLSGKPPLNLARYIRELKAYPYGCLEQTASGLFPSLYTNAAQLKALGISGDSDEKRRAAIDIGISRLLQMQLKTAALRYGIKRGRKSTG